MTATLIAIAQLLLVATALITLVRLVRGPTVFDRIVSAELLLLTLAGYLMLEAHDAEARAYLDAALGLALFSFIGTVFLARYLGKGELNE